jgi:ribulose-bisphosphate carboxylase large chain
VARGFAQVPVHGHRAGLAASMRSPPWESTSRCWQQLARLAGADHVHASGLGSKFYERDDEVAANIRSLQTPLGATIDPLPTLSSGQNVHTPVRRSRGASTDLLMLAGGGIAGHPDGPPPASAASARRGRRR